MPGLAFQPLPKTESPYDILDNRAKEIQQYFQRQGRILEQTQLTNTQFQKGLMALKAGFDEQMFRQNQYRQQLKTVESMIQKGNISPQAGQRAMWQLVMPSETAKAMFPTERAGRAGAPFSPGTMERYREDMEGTIKGIAKESLSLWEQFKYGGREEKEKTPFVNLLQRYQNWQATIGYRGMNPTQQRQLDLQWDKTMQSERYKAWNPNLSSVKSLRAKGRISRPFITPFGQSVSQSKGRTAVPEPKQADPLGIR